ncbi:glycosyltransferase family 25 protein [Bradyrhizobium sp. AZCC 2230]|uniref:glycosyltransferase family 25 protein n=1 Tax=Bradyrhizobium sp. AZCC 2230 TaxID=3117021 RepID=UPI002FF16B90
MLKIIINLPERKDRRVEMIQQLNRTGWQADFFPAVRPDSTAGFPSIGAHGCFLSHLSVLKLAKDEGASSVLIMEDDLNFGRQFADEWRSAYEQLLWNAPWSIFYPGHTVEDAKEGLARVDPDTGIRCTHFMLINGTALNIIIGEFEAILSRPAGDPLGGPMHVDGAYSTVRAKNPDLHTFCYTPSLGYQRPSRTDVGAQKLFDKVTLLRPLVGLARRAKERMLPRERT